MKRFLSNGSSLVLLIIAIAFSCQKFDKMDTVEGLSLDPHFTVEIAQKYYLDHYKQKIKSNLRVLSRGADPKAFTGRFAIKWKFAHTFSKGNLEMVEAPIRFEKIKLTAYTFDGNGGNAATTDDMMEAAFSRYVIYRDKSGRVLSRILTIIPDKAYISKYGKDASKNGAEHIEKNFSGYIEFRTWDQKSLFIYRIKEGKGVGKVKLKDQRENRFPDKQVLEYKTNSICPLICDPVYDIDCHQGDFNPESTSGHDVVCDRVVVDHHCYTDPSCIEVDDDPCSGPFATSLPECGFTGDPCIDWGICGDPPPDEPEDLCNVLKTAAASTVNSMLDGNTSILNAINAAVAFSANNMESAFLIDESGGTIVASAPVPTTTPGAPYSAVTKNSNTIAIGHDHDRESFPQPSPYDIYIAGDLAVQTNGHLKTNYIVSVSASYAIVVTDLNLYKAFSTKYPKSSNLGKNTDGSFTGDFNLTGDLGADVQQVGQVAYQNDSRAGTTPAADKLAEIHGIEVLTTYFLGAYKTGMTLLKKNASGSFKPLHYTKTIQNGQVVYLVSPCN
jgi:hypothetical protein